MITSRMSPRGRLPIRCPSCSSDLHVVELACPDCTTSVRGDYPLPPMSRLGADDQQFALAFVLHSGSLKEMARLYGVSYPTVRNRLDSLIERLGAIIESHEKDAGSAEVRGDADAPRHDE